MATWTRTAPFTFVPRTTQSGFLAVTRDELSGPEASPCFAASSATGWEPCTASTWAPRAASGIGTILHELGHVLGFRHEHQRSDRDTYITIDIDNVPGNARSQFDRH